MKKINWAPLSLTLATLFVGTLASTGASAQGRIDLAIQNTGFQQTFVENFSNGVILNGLFPLRNQQFQGVIVDRAPSPDSNELDYMMLVKTGSNPQTWPEARRLCQSLGEGWDLPRFERRFQVAASRNFAEVAGNAPAPGGRMDNFYAFWIRMDNEGGNEGESLTRSEGRNQAWVISLDSSIVNRQILGEYRLTQNPETGRLENRTGKLGFGGPAYIDGWFYIGSDQDRKFFNYQATQTEIARGGLARTFQQYFTRLRLLSPSDIEELRGLAANGTEGAAAALSARESIAAYLQTYGNRQYRGPGCSNRLATCLENAARSTDISALRAIVESNQMPNWWEAYMDDRRYRHMSGTFMRGLEPIWARLENHASAGIKLYCAKEFPKDGDMQAFQARAAYRETLRQGSRRGFLGRLFNGEL